MKYSVLALALAGAANAYINGIVPTTDPITITDSSQVPITFSTTVSPTNNLDYTLAVGLAPASDNVAAGQLGEQVIQAFNLIELGYAATGHGNFTLNVDLTTQQLSIYQPGNFTITVVATTGFGALYGTQARFFTENVQLQW